VLLKPLSYQKQRNAMPFRRNRIILNSSCGPLIGVSLKKAFLMSCSGGDTGIGLFYRLCFGWKVFLLALF